MQILWPVVIAGSVAVLMGATAIRERVRLARFFSDAHQEVFGNKTAPIRRATTPSVIVPVGAAAIAIGLTGIAMAILAPEAF